MTSLAGEDGRLKPSHRNTGKPWPGLQKRVDVLGIPLSPSDEDGTRDGLEKLSI